MVYSKKKPISKLRDGERVEDIFVVKIKKGLSSYAKGFRFSLILSDSTGRSVEYFYWGGENEEEVRSIYDSIRKDDVVLVRGWFSIYNGKPRISTNPPDSIRPLSEGEYDPREFIMPARRPVGEMREELGRHIESVTNQEVRRVLERVFSEPFLSKFSEHPGAVEIHHNWTGGLLQHTLEVARYSLLSAELFPELDRDILLAGALLHDIGKTEEIETTTRIKATVRGQLKGHIPMGFHMLSKIMEELGTEEGVRNKILHIILSHHGHNDFGSPKEPMFPEAVVVYYADEMSSKVSEIVEFVKETRESTEDEFMYHKRHSRNIFLR